jgi:hypothetical protein
MVPEARAKPVAASNLLAFALGAAALGAVAVGALAIGRLAVGRLVIRKARFGTLEVDELRVRRLHLAEPERRVRIPSRRRNVKSDLVDYRP